MCWVLNTFSCTTFRHKCLSFGFLRVFVRVSESDDARFWHGRWCVGPLLAHKMGPLIRKFCRIQLTGTHSTCDTEGSEKGLNVIRCCCGLEPLSKGE